MLSKRPSAVYSGGEIRHAREKVYLKEAVCRYHGVASSFRWKAAARMIHDYMGRNTRRELEVLRTFIATSTSSLIDEGIEVLTKKNTVDPFTRCLATSRLLPAATSRAGEKKTRLRRTIPPVRLGTVYTHQVHTRHVLR